MPFELDPPIISFVHPHMAVSAPQHHQRQTVRAWLEMGRGGHNILHSPSQTYGGWGKESLGSPCPRGVMDELTIGY